MFGDCHRQQNHYSPQVILGNFFALQLQFWLRQELINVTVTADHRPTLLGLDDHVVSLW